MNCFSVRAAGGKRDAAPGSRVPGLPGFQAPSAGALPLRLGEAGRRQAAGGGVVESAGSPQPRRAWRPP